MLNHSLEARLFFCLLVAVLTIGLAHRSLRACSVELGVAARALNHRRLKRFAADWAVGHMVTS